MPAPVDGFKCPWCDRTFEYYGNLRAHCVREHRGEREGKINTPETDDEAVYECAICHQWEGRAVNLEAHVASCYVKHFGQTTPAEPGEVKALHRSVRRLLEFNRLYPEDA